MKVRVRARRFIRSYLCVPDSISEVFAKKHLIEVLAEVDKGRQILITRDGEPIVVLASVKFMEGIGSFSHE